MTAALRSYMRLQFFSIFSYIPGKSKRFMNMPEKIRGTHKGEFIGITPTNKVIAMTGVDIDKVVNGKIVEHGGAVNTFDAFLGKWFD